MLVRELIPKIHLALKGKGSSKAPSNVGDAKYEVYLSVANDNQDRWAEDPDNDWQTLFDNDYTRSIISGVIELEEDECRPTDPIVYGNIEIPIIHFSDRHEVSHGAWVTGARGSRVVHFVNPDQYTDTVTMGIIRYPDVMVGPDSVVTCDNTRWLAYQSAAMLARNDSAKEDEADRLFTLANNEYKEGAARNMNLKRRRYRTRQNKYPRIPGL